MVVDGGTIAIQREQVRFFCCLRKRLFGMDHIAPSSLLADGSCRFFARSLAEAIPTFGEGDFMDFYLAGLSPDHEIRDIRMRGSLIICKRKALRLAAIFQDRWITLEQQGQLAFLKGLTLNGFVGFAGDRVAEVRSEEHTRLNSSHT